MSGPRQQMYTSDGYVMQQPATFPPGFGIHLAYGNASFGVKQMQQPFMQHPQPSYFHATPIQHFAPHAATAMITQHEAAVLYYHVSAVSPPGLTAPTNNMRLVRRVAAHPYGVTRPQQQQQSMLQSMQPELQPSLQQLLQQPMQTIMQQGGPSTHEQFAMVQHEERKVQQLQQLQLQHAQPQTVKKEPTDEDHNRRNLFNGPPPPAKNYDDSSPFFKEDRVESSFSMDLPPASPSPASQMSPQAPLVLDAPANGFQSILADMAEHFETVIRRNDIEPRAALAICIEALDNTAAEKEAKRRSEREKKRVRFSSLISDHDEEKEASSAGSSLSSVSTADASSVDDISPPGHADPAVFKFPANDNGDDVEVDLSEFVVEFNEMMPIYDVCPRSETFVKHVMRKVYENPRASARVTAGCGMRGSYKGYMLLPRSSIQTLARFWIQYFKSPLLLAKIEDNMTNTINLFLNRHRKKVKKSVDNAR